MRKQFYALLMFILENEYEKKKILLLLLLVPCFFFSFSVEQFTTACSTKRYNFLLCISFFWFPREKCYDEEISSG